MEELHRGIYLPTEDETWTFLRPVSMADRPFMEASLAHLSPESRQQRFLTPVSKLSDSQWEQLLNVDQENHVAWGIIPLDAEDLSASGVGRFVRLEEEPTVAEFALTVTDESQGKGFGTILLALLIWLARHKGVSVLRGYVQSSNIRMLNWMGRLGAVVEQASEGQMTVDLVLDTLEFPADSQMASLLERLEQLNVGPPEDRVLNHPHLSVLQRKRNR